MEYRLIGNTGCKVSVISLGSYLSFGESDKEEAIECITQAYNAGINFFDTAESYTNGRAEAMLGSVLNQAKWKRKDYLISTKLFWGGKGVNDVGLSRKHIIEGTDGCLDRLKMKYIDFLYCHRPDIYTDIEETVRAMTLMINQGKILYWGTSQWPAKQIIAAFKIAERKNLIPPTIEQVPYSLLMKYKLNHINPLIKKRNLGVITHSPLFSGLLTGKYHFSDGQKMENGRILRTDGDRGEMNLVRVFLSQEKLNQSLKTSLLQVKIIADELSCSLAQLSIAWVLAHRQIASVLIGSTNTKQLHENIKALDIAKRITQKQRKQLNKIENQFILRNLLIAPKVMISTLKQLRNNDYRT